MKIVRGGETFEKMTNQVNSGQCMECETPLVAGMDVTSKTVRLPIYNPDSTPTYNPATAEMSDFKAYICWNCALNFPE